MRALIRLLFTIAFNIVAACRLIKPVFIAVFVLMALFGPREPSPDNPFYLSLPIVIPLIVALLWVIAMPLEPFGSMFRKTPRVTRGRRPSWRTPMPRPPIHPPRSRPTRRWFWPY